MGLKGGDYLPAADTHDYHSLGAGRLDNLDRGLDRPGSSFSRHYPCAVGAAMMVFVARSSDRRQDRSKWHMRAFGLTVPQSVLAQADDGTRGRWCRFS